MSIYHIFLCGHCEIDTTNPSTSNSPQHVFVEGPCNSSPDCLRSDAVWYPGEEISSPADLSALNAVANELHNVRIVVKANLDKFDGLNEIPIKYIVAEVPDPGILDLLIDEDDREMLGECLFKTSTIATMLTHARKFSKKRGHRAFFDFCSSEARELVEEAKNNLDMLHDAVGALSRFERTDGLPCPFTGSFCDCASSSSCNCAYEPGNYEPDFGKEELAILRAAGDVGLGLLDQPFDLGVLHQAEVFVACMKAKKQ